MLIDSLDAFLLAFAMVSILTGALVATVRNTPYKYRKVGGLHFFRIAKLQVSLCICRKSIAA
jgi:hypothetical protein